MCHMGVFVVEELFIRCLRVICNVSLTGKLFEKSLKVLASLLVFVFIYALFQRLNSGHIKHLGELDLVLDVLKGDLACFESFFQLVVFGEV